MDILDKAILQFLLGRHDVFGHDVLQLVGASVLKDLLAGERHGHRTELRRKFGVVEQLDRRRAEILVPTIRFVIARLFMLGFYAFRFVGIAQTISSPLFRCRALLGGLFFRHRLVVAPSTPLTVSGYVCGLAQDCQMRYLSDRRTMGFPEFTRDFQIGVWLCQR